MSGIQRLSTAPQRLKEDFQAGWSQLIHVRPSRNPESRKGHVWSNDDLDPTPPERRTWGAFNYWSYWMSESWNAATWSVGSSMVANGLLWWHAILAVVFAHLIASVAIVFNGRSGSMYYVGFPVQVRASFGMWGSYWPVFSRSILAIIWFAIQGWWLGNFLDICFRCIFGDSWTNIPNHIPASSGITTRQMAAYFLGWLTQVPICFVRPHRLRHLFTTKAILMPMACFGLFIWAMVRGKGPGGFQLTENSATTTDALAWAILSAMNSAITGNFGPLITSEPDITRYAKKPRDQIIGQALSAPFMNTIVAILGIIATSASIKIYGQAYWNPGELMQAILEENPSSKTRAAIFFCSASFMFCQLCTNVSANLIPFGADSSALLPRFINIVRGQIICALIGFAIVPWLILSTGATFLQFIQGYGIFVANIVAVMIADYFIICRGNMVVADLYTSSPSGRYHYTGGWNWRAYLAYIVGVGLSFPGFIGSLGVKQLAAKDNPGTKMYDMGWPLSFISAFVVYIVVSKLFPPAHAKEMHALGFEELATAKQEVIEGVEEGSDGAYDVADVLNGEKKL